MASIYKRKNANGTVVWRAVIRIKKNPDHFLSEMATHFNTTLQAIFYALQRLKITRKKRLRFTRKETRKSELNLYKK
ncbi:MAG TPA: IS630 transposase-related protein [Rhabdochlamydiaceae bacterium]|jgi:hypothetical protein